MEERKFNRVEFNVFSEKAGDIAGVALDIINSITGEDFSEDDVLITEMYLNAEEGVAEIEYVEKADL